MICWRRWQRQLTASAEPAEHFAMEASTIRRPERAAEPEPKPARRRLRWRDLARGLQQSLRRLAVLPPRLTAWWQPYGQALGPLIERAVRPFRVVSGLGWVVLAVALLSWFVAARLGWREFSLVALVLLLLLALSVAFIVGRMRLDVSLQVEPRRVVVGDSAAAQLTVVNASGHPVLPMGLEFPVGVAVARYTLPALGPDAAHQEIVLIPTSRRGVVPLGPVSTQRGDPFGLLRREVDWTDRIEMFVHPRTVPLEPLGAGVLRDLEGRTTQDISMSDLAFHTLRPYVPGDDRRYIHWRSSAKLTAAAGQGTFLVRQFLDTRRSHIAVVVDGDPDSYAGEPEFELAVEAGASIAVRALRDEMDLTVVCGEHAAVHPPPHTALDTFSRADLDGWSLASAAGRLVQIAPDVSVVLMLTGSNAAFADLLHARSYLPPEVQVSALRAAAGAPMGLRESGGLPVLTIGALSDLPRVLVGGQAS